MDPEWKHTIPDPQKGSIFQLSIQDHIQGLPLPSEGWIRTVRKALGMSGAQLARRMKVTRAHISNSEKSEPSGSLTLKSMTKMAEAMNCQFVYAIVPNDRIETVVYQRALKKARAQVKEASVHMALEDQALNKQQLEQQIERLAQNLMEQMSADLWNDHE